MMMPLNNNTPRFQGLANQAERLSMKETAEGYLDLSRSEIEPIADDNYFVVDYETPDKFSVLKDNIGILSRLLFQRPEKLELMLSYGFRNSKHRSEARNLLDYLKGGRFMKWLGYEIKEIKLNNYGSSKVISYVEIKKK